MANITVFSPQFSKLIHKLNVAQMVSEGKELQRDHSKDNSQDIRVETVFSRWHAHTGCEELPDMVPMEAMKDKHLSPVLDNNVFQSVFEVNLRLQQSELDKPSLSKLQYL